MALLSGLIIENRQHFADMLYHLDQIYMLNCDRPNNNNALIVQLCEAELKACMNKLNQ